MVLKPLESLQLDNVTVHTVKPYIDPCLSDSVCSHNLSDNLRKALLFTDVSYAALILILKKFKASNEQSEVFLDNVRHLLCLLLPVNVTESYLAGKPPDKKHLNKAQAIKRQRKTYTQCWLKLMSSKNMTYSLMRSCLINFTDDGILKRMEDCILLADVIVPLFEFNNHWGRLTAGALLHLIHKGGVEYKNVYWKLYTLLESPALESEDCVRFFTALDTFLTSLHLPTNLVASFIKRLARLSLVSPLRPLPMVLTLILNLLRRYPHTRLLVNKSPTNKGDADESNLVNEDRFNNAASQFGQTRALESSLWELKTLQSHYDIQVAKLARQINQPLSKLEDQTSISELVMDQSRKIDRNMSHVEKSLKILKETNSKLPRLIPLEGWTD